MEASWAFLMMDGHWRCMTRLGKVGKKKKKGKQLQKRLF
jgi:hypothetical protein